MNQFQNEVLFSLDEYSSEPVIPQGHFIASVVLLKTSSGIP